MMTHKRSFQHQCAIRQMAFCLGKDEVTSSNLVSSSRKATRMCGFFSFSWEFPAVDKTIEENRETCSEHFEKMICHETKNRILCGSYHRSVVVWNWIVSHSPLLQTIYASSRSYSYNRRRGPTDLFLYDVSVAS